MRNPIVIVVSVAVVVAAAGCGSGGKKTPSTPTGTVPKPQPTQRPRIVTFDGPSVVSCGKNGETRRVSFKYVVENATAVEPEIDGQPPGAQAGYDPKRGTMRFNYVCPGPHKMTISVFGRNRAQASRTVTVEPESSG